MSAKATLLKSIPLFATPLYMYELNGHKEFNGRLIEEAENIRATSPGLNRSNQRGWHSESDFFKRTEPAIKELSQFIISCVSDVITRTSKQKATQLKCEGWININPKGGYNVPHDHAGYLWSGTYYVRVPRVENSRSGNIEFLDPRSNVSANAQTTFQTKYRISPRNGLLIVFPAYLTHWVYPNEQDEERITVAFNCSLPSLI
jgi:uncharacterized protein (TIGR02466 family)